MRTREALAMVPAVVLVWPRRAAAVVGVLVALVLVALLG